MAYVGNQPTQQSFTGGVDQYNGNNSNTVFGLTRTINTVYDVDVYVENVWQRPTTGYTVSANTITFTSAPPAGSNNVVIVYRNFAATSIIPQQGSVVHTAFAANAVPAALGYIPANKAGDVFSGAVSGITTLAAGNTTITGTLSASANVNLDSGTLFVDGTNNRVGINNAAPTSSLTVTGNAAFSNTVNITGFVDVGNTLRVNSISNPASGSGMELAYDGTQGIIQTYSNRSTLASVPVYFVNGQIKFPSSQNASSNANTLDDYEEGTWTPVITNGTTNVTQYYWQDGLYRKIGNLVWIEVQISIYIVGISSGNIKITGLPFPIAQKASLGGQTKTAIHGTKYAYPSGAITMLIEASDPSTLYPYFTADLSTQLTYTSLGAGGQWHFQGCYITTS